MSLMHTPAPSPLRRLRTLLERDSTLLIVVLSAATLYLAAYLRWEFGQVDFDIEGASDWMGSDFACFWLAARFLLENTAVQLYDVASFTAYELSHFQADGNLFYPWIYPPFAIFLVAPLALLPYTAAYFTWIAVTFILYVVLASGFKPRFWFALLLLVSPAAAVNIIGGQNGFLTAGLLMGGLLLIDRKPILAGILFGLLAIKPQLGLLVPVALIAAGRWRPFMAAAATVLALALAATLAFGIDVWPAYFNTVSSFRELTVALDDGFINLQPTVFAALRLWGATPVFAYIVQGLVTLGLIGSIWILYRRSKDRPLQAAAIGFAVLLTTPYAFVYDMPVVTVSCIILGWRGFKHGFLPGERLMLIFGWLLPITVMNLNPQHLPVAPFVLLALFALTLRRALRRPAPARPSLLKPAAAGMFTRP